jgi:hypothetical protein
LLITFFRGEFYHPLFQRDNPELLPYLQRKTHRGYEKHLNVRELLYKLHHSLPSAESESTPKILEQNNSENSADTRSVIPSPRKRKRRCSEDKTFNATEKMIPRDAKIVQFKRAGFRHPLSGCKAVAASPRDSQSCSNTDFVEVCYLLLVLYGAYVD